MWSVAARARWQPELVGRANPTHQYTSKWLETKGCVVTRGGVTQSSVTTWTSLICCDLAGVCSWFAGFGRFGVGRLCFRGRRFGGGSLCWRLLFRRLGAAVVDVPTRTLEHDADRLEDPADQFATFGTFSQHVIRELLYDLELVRTGGATVCVGRHERDSMEG